MWGWGIKMAGRTFSRGAQLLLGLLALASALPLLASTLDPSGDLDPSFSGDGKASFNFATVQVPADSRALIVQPSGKIVIGGGSNNGSFKDYVLVRMNTNGTTDSSFGNGGIAQTDMGFDDHINAMAANSTGARFCGGGISDHVFGVACYTTDGALDVTFNTTGIDKSTPPNATGAGRIEGMAFDRDDKLVVVGWSDFPTSRDWVIRRYNTDGTPDTGFGANSWVILDMGGSDRAFDVAVLKGATHAQDRLVVVGTKTASSQGVIALLTSTGQLDTASNSLTGTSGKFFGTPNGMTQFRGVAIESDGHIVVTGQGAGFLVARYTLASASVQIAPNLGIDTNDVGYRVRVDAAGKVYASGTTGSGIDFRIARLSADLSATEYATTTDFNGQSDFAQDLAVDSAGFVTAVGTAGGTLNTIAAARYTATGALDTSFGTGGKYNAFITGGSSDTSNALAVQADGSIVMTGYTLNGAGDYDLAVSRVTSAGALDTSFATSGWDVRGFGAGSADFGFGIAMDTSATTPNDNRIVVVGSSSSASAQNFLVLRYLKTGALDTSFSGDGIATGTWGPIAKARRLRCSPTAKSLSAATSPAIPVRSHLRG